MVGVSTDGCDELRQPVAFVDGKNESII